MRAIVVRWVTKTGKYVSWRLSRHRYQLRSRQYHKGGEGTINALIRYYGNNNMYQPSYLRRYALSSLNL